MYILTTYARSSRKWRKKLSDKMCAFSRIAMDECHVTEAQSRLQREPSFDTSPPNSELAVNETVPYTSTSLQQGCKLSTVQTSSQSMIHLT